ncbi:hypothetical protein FISHEDRAFT_74435 [Fistulina hepatica ATCC 64428]|uniref:Uncharacterized protein n=1 Tax=Fistulina hepatica ATCC 64428 TaxID=1128425 RepID=A0A0D7ACG4_9AGAR|nr:hypothetical protein FISHEDRAFT_74435 [Fistulina hepatica ATCC 64428]
MTLPLVLNSPKPVETHPSRSRSALDLGIDQFNWARYRRRDEYTPIWSRAVSDKPDTNSWSRLEPIPVWQLADLVQALYYRQTPAYFDILKCLVAWIQAMGEHKGSDHRGALICLRSPDSEFVTSLFIHAELFWTHNCFEIELAFMASVLLPRAMKPELIPAPAILLEITQNEVFVVESDLVDDGQSEASTDSEIEEMSAECERCQKYFHGNYCEVRRRASVMIFHFSRKNWHRKDFRQMCLEEAHRLVMHDILACQENIISCEACEEALIIKASEQKKKQKNSKK